MPLDGIAAELAQIGAELKTVEKATATRVRRNIRRFVAEAGSDITGEIRKKAEAQGLQRAARATRMRVSFGARSAGATVSTSAKQAPDAKAYELGNRGRSPGSGVFRHPVPHGGRGGGKRGWGRGKPTSFTYVDEAKRPYFFVSTKRKTPETVAKFETAIEAALLEAGWRPGGI